MEEERQLTKQERKALRREEKIALRGVDEKRKLVSKIALYASVLGVIGLIVLGIFNSIVPIPQNEKNKTVEDFTGTEWINGQTESVVKIIEYSDFQCPSCANASSNLKEILSAYAGKVALAYRNFPLREIHPQADLAAQAAEAAGMQGKFWEMHNKLFENQDAWAENRGAKGLFVGYAKELELDMNKFRDDLGSKEVKALVQADYLSGLEQGISSTPTFFINGQMIPNPGSLSEFAKVVELALETATASASLK